jgi:exocyst complex component 2
VAYSEVIDFWESAQSFIDGKVQKTLPTGIDGQSRKHHRLSSDGTRDLQNGAVELIDIIRENVFSFCGSPIEDISMLFSPLPPNT